VLSNFLRDTLELLVGKLVKFRGRVDRFQQVGHQ
jgi:hypothetical protein